MATPIPSPSGAHPSKIGTLSPLPAELHVGLIPVAALAFLSFVAATSLFFFLVYRMIQWRLKSHATNQFVFLIANLLFADIQQSLAFLLNAQWVAKDAIDVTTKSCWAQGWFISTGDMGSGAWSFAIGMHTFATVIFGYRLSSRVFLVQCVLIWCFIYGLALGGVRHSDIYVRANAWCWVNSRYPGVRLWLHYFWIYFFEFGTVLVYTVMILALRVRIQSNFYQTKEEAKRATDAAKLMVAYPIIYVLCTLPLATLRMVSIQNAKHVPALKWFCFAGAMITSNGWLDVLLYSLTRRILLFSDGPPPTDNGIDSFGTPWLEQPVFGTHTTCEHVPTALPRGAAKKHFAQTSVSTTTSDTELRGIAHSPYRQRRANSDLLDSTTFTKQTTVEVGSEIMNSAEKREVRRVHQKGRSMVPMLGSNKIEQAVKNDCDGESSTRRLWQGINDGNADVESLHAGHNTPSEISQHSEQDGESVGFKFRPRPI